MYDTPRTDEVAQSDKQTADNDDSERTEEQPYLLMRLPISTNDEYDLTIEKHRDACRTPNCNSRIHVRDVISERGSVTLCRPCRKEFWGVSS